MQQTGNGYNFATKRTNHNSLLHIRDWIKKSNWNSTQNAKPTKFAIAITSCSTLTCCHVGTKYRKKEKKSAKLLDEKEVHEVEGVANQLNIL